MEPCTLTYYEDEDFQLSIHHGSHMILQAVLNLCSRCGRGRMAGLGPAREC